VSFIYLSLSGKKVKSSHLLKNARFLSQKDFFTLNAGDIHPSCQVAQQPKTSLGLSYIFSNYGFK